MRIFTANIVGFLQASRIPNLITIGVVQVLAAVFLLYRPISEIFFNLYFYLLISSTLLTAAAGYIINDYYDQKIDLINRPMKVVVGVRLQRIPALLAHFSLNVMAISIGFFISPYVGAFNFLIAFVLWLYSNQLRRLPLVGNVAIGFLHGAVILAVMIYFQVFTKLALVYLFFAFIIALIREIIKDIEDLKGESAFGCSTLPVIWGIRGTKLVIYFFSAGGIGVLVLFLLVGANQQTQLYFAFLSPIFFWFLYRIHVADTKKEYRTLHKIINWIIFSGILSIAFLHE